jgi:hypothetical protein
MTYLTEREVRARAAGQDFGLRNFDVALPLHLIAQMFRSHFDIFLSHSFRDAELILGVKLLLEAAGKTVYVDWIVDQKMDRSQVSAATADKLRGRMRQYDALFYIYTQHSRASRWMPWELGYFDGYNGNVAILPIVPDHGSLDFDSEEYLQLYPKVDAVNPAQKPSLFVNRAQKLEPGEYLSFDDWRVGTDKLQPTV